MLSNSFIIIILLYIYILLYSGLSNWYQVTSTCTHTDFFFAPISNTILVFSGNSWSVSNILYLVKTNL